MGTKESFNFGENALCLAVVCVLLIVALITLIQLIPFVSEVLSASLNEIVI